jgi:L-threonylcarbamoyladenylate synthase
VWGLGCDPFSESATNRILALKQRPIDKGLILIGSKIAHFASMIDGLDEAAKNLFGTPQKRPTTWLVPHNGVAPNWIVGAHDTVALRITDHPIASALCEVFGGPIVSTSANPQSLPAAATSSKVAKYFHNKLDFIAPGDVAKSGKESEIKSILTGEVLRPG